MPEIQVVENQVDQCHLQLDMNTLKQHLIETAQNQLEDAYLYSLYQTGQDWIQDAKERKDSSTTPVCKYFLEGRCRFNEKCRNLHPSGHTNAITKRTDQTAHLSHSTHNKMENSNTSVMKESTAVENSKKPRMRTATDVISRIQWDPELLEADFIIGYSDRFLGIVEKNFAEFCWDDLSTVGLEMLAIPKHRIQYFKYRNDIVWDRRVQLDKFFGSRGEGITIHDLVRNHTEITPS